jgi:hypothetical protein
MLGARDFLLQRTWKAQQPISTQLGSLIQTAEEAIEQASASEGTQILKPQEASSSPAPLVSGPVNEIPLERASTQAPALSKAEEIADASKPEESKFEIEGSLPETGPVDTVIAETKARGEEPRNHIQNISDDCRIVSFGNMLEDGTGYRARLEYRQNAFWLPVILYEINDDSSARHQFHLDGSRKTRKIALPPKQAKQMANNDLNKNWRQYVDGFLKQQ